MGAESKQTKKGHVTKQPFAGKATKTERKKKEMEYIINKPQQIIITQTLERQRTCMVFNLGVCKQKKTLRR